jgi:hypothetical protein
VASDVTLLRNSTKLDSVSSTKSNARRRPAVQHLDEIRSVVFEMKLADRRDLTIMRSRHAPHTADAVSTRIRAAVQFSCRHLSSLKTDHINNRCVAVVTETVRRQPFDVPKDAICSPVKCV